MTSILEAVKATAALRPQALALIDGKIAVSYETMWYEIAQVAGRLRSLGEANGAVGLYMDNCPAWAVLDLAFVKLGWPCVPLPVFFTEAQRQHAVNQAGVRFLVTDCEVPGWRGAVTFRVFDSLYYFYSIEREAAKLPENAAKVTFTSGSTGQPKGVCLPQARLEQVANSLVAAIGTNYAGVHCAVLPLPVLLETVAGLYPVLLAGGTYYVRPQALLGFEKGLAPDFSMLVQALIESDTTSAILVPGILRGLCQTLEAERLSLPALKLLAVGGARVDGALLKKAQALGLPVFQGYGLSEAGSVVALNTPHANRLGSVGRSLPGAGVELAADGEILLQKPAFAGYLGQETTPECFATGDIGHFDADGYLYIDGRKSARLITAFGRNVSPEWVESELISQPEISQALVFGEAAPALGSLLVPSTKNVTTMQIEEAVARANGALPDYARIQHWSRVEPFSTANNLLTANGRLRRMAIHEKYQDLMVCSLEIQG
jgi:long-subunit acyl-CoA synthetase (AMP-forming)